MTTKKRYAVVNASTKCTDLEVETMALAVKNQLFYHVAPAWGKAFMDSVFVPTGGTVPADCYPIYILDNADVAGALGYHTEDPGGNIYGRVFAGTVLSAPGGTVLSGSVSVSACLSHEVMEFFVDKGCNLWAQYDATHMVAYEVGDPVENDSYNVHATVKGVTSQVAVSNFVLDAWFDGQQTEPGVRFDWMNRVTAPLKMTSGGYLVLMDTTTGQTSQVFGSKEAETLHNQMKPAHPATRAARRAH
jgi:hypothetical protein